MIAKSIVVLIENKKGDFWQVALNEQDGDAVMYLIKIMHNGTIKALRNKLPLKYDKILKP